MFFWICLLSPLIFLLNALIIGWVSPGYNFQTTAISQLVHYKFGSFQTANFIICGLLSFGLAYYISEFSDVSSRHEKSLVMAGAITFGLCLVTVGLFRTDPAGQTTLVGRIHNIAFISSVLIQGALQVYFAFSRLPQPVGIYFLLSGALTITGLFAMSLLPELRGIAQRILVLAISLWVSIGPLLVRR